MKPSETRSRDWIDARVEAYLDGDLPGNERAVFEDHLAGEADWEAELFLARQIRDGLRALPRPACPPHVTEAVLAHARRAAWASRPDGLRAWIERQWTAWWQPALAMAVLLAIVVSAALFGRPPGPAYSDEVARARAGVEWTLAYLSEVGRQTGKAVRHDVIEKRVVAPVREAFGTRPKRQHETQR